MINPPALIDFCALTVNLYNYHVKFPVDNSIESLYNRIKGAEGKSSAEPIPQRAGVAENRRIRLCEHGSGAPHAIFSVRRAFPLQMRLMFVGH